jgi:hypothetical protein
MVLCDKKFDFSFETEVNDLISIKREAFKTILEFQGIRSVEAPGERISPKEEKQEQLKEIAERARSPVVEEIQGELVQQLQKEVEKDTQTYDLHIKKKKRTIFGKLRAFLRKNKCAGTNK